MSEASGCTDASIADGYGLTAPCTSKRASSARWLDDTRQRSKANVVGTGTPLWETSSGWEAMASLMNTRVKKNLRMDEDDEIVVMCLPQGVMQATGSSNP